MSIKKWLMPKRKLGAEKHCEEDKTAGGEEKSAPIRRSAVEKINIARIPSVTPKFQRQSVISTDGMFDLGDGNKLLLVHELLPDDKLILFISAVLTVPRQTGKSAFNSMKPRRELCYTVEGKPYLYSGRKHPTTRFPSHVTDLLLPFCMEEVRRYILDNRFDKLSHGVDILYNGEFPRGGSIGAHSDNEMPWGLVLIYSLGQTRWLRLRRKSDGAWYNIEASHNSLIAMHGVTFQTLFTHQVDKLQVGESVHNRLSINVRFLEDT